MSQIYPSLLSADFSRLAEEVRAVEEAGADGLHLDIMDGHFVPNLTFGAPVIAKLRPHTQLFFDCHLMVTQPDALVDDFAEAGAERITVHQEACVHLHRSLQRIRAAGCKAGVSLNPATPLETLDHVLDDLDLILCMTVNPGFGGQKLIPAALKKAGALVERLKQRGLKDKILVQIDGGVDPKTAPEARRLGIDILVAGNAVFGQKDYTSAIKALRN
jgi:ribulose-phosphate 3-epimerase